MTFKNFVKTKYSTEVHGEYDFSVLGLMNLIDAGYDTPSKVKFYLIQNPLRLTLFEHIPEILKEYEDLHQT